MLGRPPYWPKLPPQACSYMKTIILGLCGCGLLILLASGCSTFQGGDSDTYYQNSARSTALSDDTEGVNIGSSPSMRPGMNPRDIRDPNNLTHPLAPTPTIP